MSARRSALGRGLGALIPSGEAGLAASRAADEGSTRPDSERRPLEIAVDAIQPNPDQPRRHFDPGQLAGLAGSIARHGVLQPVVVRRAEGGGYELIVGERRWRASRAAGRETVPAVVADIEPRDRLELAIVENVQRHDLNPIELAHAYRTLAGSGATQEEIGSRVGLDRSSIANHLRLLELPLEFQQDVELGRLSMGHAKALLQVVSPERRRLLRDRIVREQLSVRATEQLARDYAKPGRARKPQTQPSAQEVNRTSASDASLASLVEPLRQALQTQVRIEGSLERGHIEIDYFGAEDLERIADLLVRGA
ncbi:MAG: ParB/RepB/Spo0J family partition protein [Myxococcota bacterium]|nr:ParB/RepB/Spo0J family partition protein [Myxococcota bacterium]